MKKEISITAIATVSALGHDHDKIWEEYGKPDHLLEPDDQDRKEYWLARLSEDSNENITAIRDEYSAYRNLDMSVLFALYVSRKAFAAAGWGSEDEVGINLGSSRGATALFEKYHKEYLETKKTSTRTSPTTTLGNIASWVAHDLQTKGPVISHSITCSTALHAFLNGVAWISSGMAKKFLVGGSEAALTPFTLAQMKALKIYSEQGEPYPCRALDLSKSANTMVLGEGAGVVALEPGLSTDALAMVAGVGYATEPLTHSVSLSSDARCFQQSMNMALGDISSNEVDVVVMHAPGTLKGDQAEYEAIKQVFGKDMPALTTNKWKIGHTFGASGILSMEMAILMMRHQEFVSIPYIKHGKQPGKIEKVMVNAVGFGGNAVSILLERPK